MVTEQYVGVIGAGKFGFALAQLMAPNTKVLLYSRRSELVDSINSQHSYKGISLPENVTATTSIEEVCDKCQLLLPVISSVHFRKVIHGMAPYLTPEHMMIHGTKRVRCTSW